ncbi:uncharacterized protein LOC128993459 [Macrosteles quadrilineatus]|uniref:uncharacterized protein LOC128993459 n=1 Tax=Macrosteles quadrilineatus TaxID=74068 RepID=UPI0023E0FD38|nr:uncharacterized protein LOC128993459 [Macrosteles quadrilineatus]
MLSRMGVFYYYGAIVYVLLTAETCISFAADPELASEPLEKENASLPMSGLSSFPGWWDGPEENSTLEETTETGNLTSDQSMTPEMLTETLVPENGTFVFTNDFLVEGIEEEMMQTANGTEVLMEDFLVVPLENVTAANMGETTVLPEDAIEEAQKKPAEMSETTEVVKEPQELLPTL